MNSVRRFLIIAGCVCGLSLMAGAQDKDKNDYSNNRDKENRREKSDPPAEHPTLVKFIQRIQGSWELEAVYDGQKEVSGNDTVATAQEIVFTRENKYKRYSNNEQIDSGVFTMNENHSLVYLESKSGNETSAWTVTLNDQNDSMTMQQTQSTAAHGKQFRFVYRKKTDAAGQNR